MKDMLLKLFTGLVKVIFKLLLIALYSITRFAEIFLQTFNGWLKGQIK
ncbi:MAG: hypothetical protein WC223_01410 [Bacteroidales bacterium]|jgi:hypothetical protein